MTGSTLTAYLATLVSETPQFQNGARVLDHSSARDTLFDEIDATVLPAVLTFESDTASLSLLVTGRRLNRIVSGGGAEVDGKALSPDDAAMTKAAAQALADFADAAKELRVRSTAPEHDAADMSDRISIRALQNALGMVVDDPDAPPLERFVTRMGEAITASIHLDDRVAAQTTGPNIDVAGLKIILTTQLSAFMDARIKNCPSHSEPSLTLFADVIETGTSAGLATFDTQTLLFTCTTADLPIANDAFRKVT